MQHDFTRLVFVLEAIHVNCTSTSVHVQSVHVQLWSIMYRIYMYTCILYTYFYLSGARLRQHMGSVWRTLKNLIVGYIWKLLRFTITLWSTNSESTWNTGVGLDEFPFGARPPGSCYVLGSVTIGVSPNCQSVCSSDVVFFRRTTQRSTSFLVGKFQMNWQTSINPIIWYNL